MIELKVRKFGNDLGVVFPQEAINHLHIGDGQALFLVEAPDGGYLISLHDPTHEDKMAKIEDICNRYQNTLRVLAQ